MPKKTVPTLLVKEGLDPGLTIQTLLINATPGQKVLGLEGDLVPSLIGTRTSASFLTK